MLISIIKSIIKCYIPQVNSRDSDPVSSSGPHLPCLVNGYQSTAWYSLLESGWVSSLKEYIKRSLMLPKTGVIVAIRPTPFLSNLQLLSITLKNIGKGLLRNLSYVISVLAMCTSLLALTSRPWLPRGKCWTLVSLISTTAPHAQVLGDGAGCSGLQGGPKCRTVNIFLDEACRVQRQ